MTDRNPTTKRVDTNHEADGSWEPGVIARYLTVGGATVDVAEQSGYYICAEATETQATCTGVRCTDPTYTVEWGFSITAHESGRQQPSTFDKGGTRSTPQVLAWAQSHAEKCRAMPKPQP